MKKCLRLLKFLYAYLGLVLVKKNFVIWFNKLFRSEFKNISYIQFKIKKNLVFFGYYDINPISKDNSKILAVVTPKSKVTKNIAQIGFLKLINQKNLI